MSDIAIARFYENKQQEAFLRCMEEYGQAMFSWNLVIDLARKCIVRQLNTNKLKAKDDKAAIKRIETRINRYWKSRDDNRIIDGLKRVCKEDILGLYIEGHKNPPEVYKFKDARNVFVHHILAVFDHFHREHYDNFNPEYVGIDVVEKARCLIKSFRDEVERREEELHRLWEQINRQYEEAKSTVANSDE